MHNSQMNVNDLASVETSDLFVLIGKLLDELIRRDEHESTHVYSVDGVYNGRLQQITGDIVVAVNEEEAAERVDEVRKLSSDEWRLDLVSRQLERIKFAMNCLETPRFSISADLDAMVKDFGGQRCLRCQIPSYEDDLNSQGCCSSCDCGVNN
jgi:hypothetical protein